ASPFYPPKYNSIELCFTPSQSYSVSIQSRRGEMAAEAETALAKCLGLLRQASDEHKFAGLIMLTKHVDLTQDRTPILEKVNEAIDKGFLRRLIRTRSEGGVSAYQSLAAGVLALLSSVPDVAADLVKLVPDVVWVLDNTTEVTTLADCSMYLGYTSLAPDGMKAVLRAGSIHSLVERLVGCWGRHQGGEAEAEAIAAGPQQVFEQWSVDLLYRVVQGQQDAAPPCNDQCHSPDTAGGSTLEELAGSRLEAVGCEIKAIASALVGGPGSPPRQELLQLLSAYASVGGEIGDEPELAGLLRAGIVQSLPGAAAEGVRDAAFALVVVLMQRIGQGWAVEEVEGSQRGKFVELILQLVKGEVRLLLHESLSLLLPGDDTEIPDMGQGPVEAWGEKGGDAAKGKREQLSEMKYKGPSLNVHGSRVERIQRMLPVLLGIVEHTVLFLTELDDESETASEGTGGQSWESLPGSSLLSIKDSLDSTFRTVLEYFKELRPYIMRQQGAEEIKEEHQQALEQLGMVCVRAAGLWAAEDPSTLQDEFLQVLPTMLRLAQPRRIVVVEEGEEELDSDDEVDTDAVKEIEVDPGLEGMPCLLRAMLAMSYEDTSLSALVDCCVPQKLLRFLQLGMEPRPGGESLDPGVACWACAVLLNIMSKAGHLPQCEEDGLEAHCAVLFHPTVVAAPQMLARIACRGYQEWEAGRGLSWRQLCGYSTCLALHIAKAGGVEPTLHKAHAEDFQHHAEVVSVIVDLLSSDCGAEEYSVWQWCVEVAKDIDATG
ncbi:unnamed protein product, partial [Chrysoparadoxa australica]